MLQISICSQKAVTHLDALVVAIELHLVSQKDHWNHVYVVLFLYLHLLENNPHILNVFRAKGTGFLICSFGK